MAFERYAVTGAASGEAALETLQRGPHDIVLLDLGMPGMGGLATCRAIRTNSDVPIIVVSAHRVEADKIGALDAGSIDYITKPFSIGELLASISAVLRRAPLAEGAPRVVRTGDIEISFAAHRVLVAGKDVHRTRKEFHLLQCLVSNPNTPL